MRHLLLTSVLVTLISSDPVVVPDKGNIYTVFTSTEVVKAMTDCFFDETNDLCSVQQMKIKVPARQMLLNKGRCLVCTPEEQVIMENNMKMLVESMIDCIVDDTNDICSETQMRIKDHAKEMLVNMGRCLSCTPDELIVMENSMVLLQGQNPALFTKVVFAMMGVNLPFR